MSDFGNKHKKSNDQNIPTSLQYVELAIISFVLVMILFALIGGIAFLIVPITNTANSKNVTNVTNVINTTL